MQKKIIALAIAAAFSAPAFADVTVYGLVDAAVAHLSADGQKSDTQAVSGGLSSSRIGVKSAEDLGNGLKAVINLEYGLDTETSAGILTARQQMVGLASDFGTVATGYLQTTAWDFQNSYDPTSGSTVSPLGNLTKGGGFLIGSVAAANRAQRALAYISPNMGGVTVAVNYSTALAGLGNLTQASTATTGLKTTATLLSVNYAGGPVAVGGVFAKLTPDSAGASSVKEYALGGSFDFGVAKIFGTYQSQSPAVGSSNKAESIGVVVPAGPGAVVASYAKNKIATTTTAKSAKGATIGYLYNLSATTTAYAAYSKMSQDLGTNAYSVDNNALSAGTLTAGGSSSMLAIGLRKKF
jgi:predicted porin